MKLSLALVILSLTTLTAFAAPAGWPQFRGPARNGVSAESRLLKQWPKDGPPLAWQIKGLGKGMSSVAISDGKIITMGARKGGQFVIAFDLATRKELWAARVSETDDGPNGTPCIDTGLVFAVS